MSAIIEEIPEGVRTFTPIVCNECARRTGLLSCEAFERIPDEILRGKNKHSKPLRGQTNDLTFLQR